MGDLMDRIAAQTYGLFPVGSYSPTVTPGMGGLSADMAPGVIAPLNPDTGSNGQSTVGRTGLAIIAVAVLAIVAFNVSTRAYQR